MKSYYDDRHIWRNMFFLLQDQLEGAKRQIRYYYRYINPKEISHDVIHVAFLVFRWVGLFYTPYINDE